MAIDRRLQAIDQVMERLASNVERELTQNYAHSLRKVRSIIAQYYAKYGAGGGMNLDQMTKFNRMRNLQRELEAELRSLATDKGNAIRSGLRRVYAESYYRSGWAVESAARAYLGYSSVRPEVVNASIQNPISGLTLNERLNVHRRDIITRIQQEVTQGLVRGESYTDMAKRLKGALEGDLVKAKRIVRTEGHRVMESGKSDSLQHAADKGVRMQKKWISSRDESVRSHHQEMDGQIVDYDDDFETPDGYTGPAPGMMGAAHHDINCRCIFIVIIVGVSDNLKPHNELERMKYETWRKERVA